MNVPFLLGGGCAHVNGRRPETGLNRFGNSTSADDSDRLPHYTLAAKTPRAPNAMHRFSIHFSFEFLGALGVLAAKILNSG
jgi:hypothetical protein